LDTALVAKSIDCSIASADPKTELNLIGKDNITITGTGFPWDLKSIVYNNTVEIEFTNVMKTKCIPKWSTSTKLICITEKFDTTADVGGTNIGVNVKINGQTVTNTIKFAMKASY